MAKRDVSVLLVRSGPSSWDEAGRIEGRNDLPLSDAAVEGVRNAVARRTRDGGLLPDLVLYWGEHGSKQTADVVCGQAACKGKVSEGLAPVSLGLWEGTLADELMERTPKSFKRWQADPTAVTAPEGESTGAFEERFVAMLGRIAEKHGGKVVALVLRPLEFALAVSLLEGVGGGEAGDSGLDVTEVWGGGGVLREYVVNTGVVRLLSELVKVGT